MPKKKKKKSVTKKSLGKDVLDIEPVNITVVYGDSGTGKTTFLGTCPKPLAIIDVGDRGVESAKTRSLERGDIIVYPISTFDEIWDVMDDIREGDFKSVGVDHLTALQEMIYKQIMDKKGVKFMHQNFYADSAPMMREFIAAFNSFADEGITPIYLAQQRTVETDGGDIGDDEEEVKPDIIPNIQPAVAITLMASARILVQTHIQGVENKKGKITMEYRMRTGASPYYKTKITRQRDTSPCPKYLVNPTWDSLMQIVNGEWESTKKSKKKKKGSK